MSKQPPFLRPKISNEAAIRTLLRIAKDSGLSVSAVCERAVVLYGRPLAERLAVPAEGER